MAEKTPEKPKAEKPRTLPDPELLAMRRICRELEGLTPDARGRIIAWLVARLDAEKMFTRTTLVIPPGQP